MRRGTSLQVHAHLKRKQNQRKEAYLKGCTPFPDHCKLSLGLTGQGSLLHGGNQETMMQVCQNSKKSLCLRTIWHIVPPFLLHESGADLFSSLGK